jgi:hypothetical protein
LERKLRHGFLEKAGKGAQGIWDAGVLTDGVCGAGGGAGWVGGLGMYSGPVWPQPASKAMTTSATPVLNATRDFTIRIRV